MGHSATPSSWVTRFAAGLPAGTSTLDLACGGGRHARWALEAGHRVTTLDRDLSGIADLQSADLERICADLEDGSPWPLGGRTFDLVLVTNYLHRPLFPALCAAVAAGGMLIYETFAAGNEEFGRPRRPEFLLRGDELLTRCAELQTLAFEQGRVDDPKPAVVQRICAIRPHPDARTHVLPAPA